MEQLHGLPAERVASLCGLSANWQVHLAIEALWKLCICRGILIRGSGSLVQLWWPIWGKTILWLDDQAGDLGPEESTQEAYASSFPLLHQRRTSTELRLSRSLYRQPQCQRS